MMTLDRIREKKAFLIDMDGVIYHGKFLLPGVPEFISWLREEGKLYRFVTNNSYFTAAELSERLCAMGIDERPGTSIRALWQRPHSVLIRQMTLPPG